MPLVMRHQESDYFSKDPVSANEIPKRKSAETQADSLKITPPRLHLRRGQL